MTAVSDRPTRVTPDNPTINTTYLSEHLLGRWADLRKSHGHLPKTNGSSVTPTSPWTNTANAC